MKFASDTDPALPRFIADTTPPVKLPAGRTLGAVVGVQVSPDGHIWVLHIAANMEWGPPGSLQDPAARLPAVCEFDARGNYLQGWGGPDWLPREKGLQQWPRQEETIAFDREDTFWVFGADKSYDHAVQRFTRDGELLLRIGRFGATGGEDHPQLLGCPTDAWHDIERREVYISDGYVNHRVAVFNSDSGEFIRSFGAYGHSPCEGAGPAESFDNPVHAILPGPDGNLYICDRMNNRVQVFNAVGRREPEYLRELVLDVASPFGATFNVVFTADNNFMIVNDGSNSRLWVVDLARWEFVDNFLAPDSAAAGLEATVHKITTDAEGNLLLARTARGLERMVYKQTGVAAR